MRLRSCCRSSQRRTGSSQLAAAQDVQLSSTLQRQQRRAGSCVPFWKIRCGCWLSLDQAGHNVEPNNRILFALAPVLDAGRSITFTGLLTPCTKLWEPILLPWQSGEQHRMQLFGLSCSMLKVCSAPTLGNLREPEKLLAVPQDRSSVLRQRLSRAVCHTAVQVLQTAASAYSVSSSGDGIGSSGATSSNGGDGSNDSSSSGSSASPVASLLPWLVLIGRCLMWWAQELFGLQNKAFGGHMQPSSAADRTAANAACMAYVKGLFELLLAASTDALLSCQDVSAQLTAAGYDVEIWRAKLQDDVKPNFAAAVAAIDAGSADAVLSDAVGGVVMLMSSTANYLPYTPMSLACNSSSCRNVGGSSECQLVLGSNSR